MKWQGRRKSRNIEDLRSQGRKAGSAGGIGGIGLIVILVAGYFLGIDVSPLLNGQTGGGAVTESAGITPQDQQAAEFVSVVLADTEAVWADIFPQQFGTQYDPATLVLFKGGTQSPCGGASAASGPFYCPADRKAYLDTSFFVTMQDRLGAGVTLRRLMLWRTRLPTTFKTSWVFWAKPTKHGAKHRPRNQTRFRFGLNCRPIAIPEFGPAQCSKSSARLSVET